MESIVISLFSWLSNLTLGWITLYLCISSFLWFLFDLLTTTRFGGTPFVGDGIFYMIVLTFAVGCCLLTCMFAIVFGYRLMIIIL
jgi:hypothetical protein